jgi:hypothetical protein
VLANLEKAQEDRALTLEEMEFKKYLKSKALGIAKISSSPTFKVNMDPQRRHQYTFLPFARKYEKTEILHSHP